MNVAVGSPDTPATTAGGSGPGIGWVRGIGVYVVMVAAALGCIATASESGDVAGSGIPAPYLWLFLVPLYFLVCVWNGWARATLDQQRLRLLVTQALHWASFAGAMAYVLTPQMRGVLDDDAVGLALVLLLALGTFLAGVHAWSLSVSVTGVVLAFALPVLAWVEDTVMTLLLCVVGALVALLVVWVVWHRWLRARPAPVPA